MSVTLRRVRNDRRSTSDHPRNLGLLAVSLPQPFCAQAALAINSDRENEL
jgi:hypothetical protein